jgi:hypothetical protein
LQGAFDLNERLGIQPELNLTGKYMSGGKIFTRYIEAPVFLRMYLAETKNGRFFGMIGPSVGYLLDAQNNNTGVALNGFRQLNLAANIGLGSDVLFTERVGMMASWRIQQLITRPSNDVSTARYMMLQLGLIFKI